jgi:probable HAF family extracellular repeat protein
MKSGTLTCITTMTFFAALAVPLQVAAQHTQYKLVDTGTLGGPISSLGFEGERDLNNQGTLVSLADTSLPDPYAPACLSLDCFLAHAVEWRNGVLTDLGALPAVNSSGPQWISDTGLVSGFSENGVIDPLTGFPEFQAVLWKGGRMTDLGTLGGNESFAEGVNNQGQVAGCATNATPDSFGLGCVGVPQQSRAFLWSNGVMQDLGTLGGPDSAAGLVNERGQVAGWALLNSTPNPTTGIPTQHPFLWEKGTMMDLGTIGGTAVYEVNGLNNRGQVIGGMNVAGDQSFHPFLWDGETLRDLGTFGGAYGSANWINESTGVVGWAWNQGQQTRAFLWKNGRMTNLGTVDGDLCSVGYGINSSGQIVGGSGSSGCGTYSHAFVWEQGRLIDLNTLVTGAGVQLTVALSINESGMIAAQGVLPNGDLHAFVLIPCGKGDAGGADSAAAPAIQPSISANPAPRDRPSEMLSGLRNRFPGRRAPGPAVGPTR